MNKLYLIRFTIILALMTQVSHAAYLFALISKTSNNWLDIILSYTFAISLELSIYIFTLENKKSVATFFAVISVLINLLYYWNFTEFNQYFYASILISFIIPITIWNYSDLIKEYPKKRIYIKKDN